MYLIPSLTPSAAQEPTEWFAVNATELPGVYECSELPDVHAAQMQWPTQMR